MLFGNRPTNLYYNTGGVHDVITNVITNVTLNLQEIKELTDRHVNECCESVELNNDIKECVVDCIYVYNRMMSQVSKQSGV